MATSDKDIPSTPSSTDNVNEETPDARKARLSRPVGVTDFVIASEKCPEIPTEFLMKLMFGGR